MIATMKGCDSKRKQEREKDVEFLKSTAENNKSPKVARGSRARKSKVRERLSEDGCCGFVKKELEAIETLTEFFRQVQPPAKNFSLQHTRDYDFTWGVKRRRSISFVKGENHPTLEAVGEDATSADVWKRGAQGESGLKVVKQVEARFISLECSKDFSFEDFRAESPNPPLPVLKDGCFMNRNIIVPKDEEASPPAAFQRPSMLFDKINQPSSHISSTNEARRLRRVQANRESARQTIRRKQIFCEELAKRATELGLLNENMKQESAVLKQEIWSLYVANCFLKQQCASIDIQGSCKVLSQFSPDAGPSSSPTVHVPFIPGVSLPYPAYSLALPLNTAGGMSFEPLQAEDETVCSSEKSEFTSYANSVAFGFWLAMGVSSLQMQMPLSTSSQSAAVIHLNQSKSGSPLSHVPVDRVDVFWRSGRVENVSTSSPCEEIGVESAQMGTSPQEQKTRPEPAPQSLNCVCLVTDTEVGSNSVWSSALQSAQNWQLTVSSCWDCCSRAIKPFGRQNQLTSSLKLEKQYSIIERKESDLLQGHQRHLAHFFARRDGAARKKAAEARMRRKKITRNKNLLRQRISKG